ncbi:MAG: protein arginine kinase [Candidatus Omnitrophota bacterium]|jgi:protein arginine kinase
MNLDDLVKKKSEWLKGEGPKANIVISSRVRVARNLKGHLYFDWASDEQCEEALGAAEAAVKKTKFLKNALFLRMKDTTDVDRLFLVERHLMSQGHMDDVSHKGLAIEEKEIVSVMINEEDHLRLQVLQSGFNITEAWRIVDDIDTDLGRHLTFDFSDRFGYLTSCPTNTGTGLRASVMLHLPALAITGQIDNVYRAISKLGLTIRGFYGEGTEASGDFYQISNQVALGHSEMDILDNLEKIINKIISKEESTREILVKKRKQEVSDQIYRSFGTLKSARIITSNETIKLLSAVRLGADLGLIKDVDTIMVNEILLSSQPAHLQKMAGKELNPNERDVKRADLIRERFGNK